jgi:hypothetical protein
LFFRAVTTFWLLWMCMEAELQCCSLLLQNASACCGYTVRHCVCMGQTMPATRKASFYSHQRLKMKANKYPNPAAFHKYP